MCDYYYYYYYYRARMYVVRRGDGRRREEPFAQKGDGTTGTGWWAYWKKGASGGKR